MDVKSHVQRLRQKGRTYTEICQELKVKIPKSTLSYWCKEIKLPTHYSSKIKSLNIITRTKILENKILKRQTFLNEIETRNKILFNKKLNKNIQKLILAFLYLGEGSKWKSHRGLCLGSSDPVIISIYIKLLENVYGIRRNKLKARISYRADQNIENLMHFWMKVTNFSKDQFYRTRPDPRTLGKKTKDENYKGVCVITCAGTNYQLELEAIPKIIFEKI